MINIKKILEIGKQIINSKIFLYCVIGGIIYFWIQDRKELRQNIQRLETNQIALSINHSIQQQMTSSEFKMIHYMEDSIARLIKIKPKQLQNIIVNNYHYHNDSTHSAPLQPIDPDININSDITIDSDINKKDTLYFKVPINCGEIKGRVINNIKVDITRVELQDKLHTYLYGITRKHKFLFIKWGDWVVSNAATYSECMKDTINVEKNIKIIK